MESLLWERRLHSQGSPEHKKENVIKKEINIPFYFMSSKQRKIDVVLLSCLKGVFGDSRQAVVHVASSTRVDYYLTYLVGFT